MIFNKSLTLASPVEYSLFRFISGMVLFTLIGYGVGLAEREKEIIKKLEENNHYDVIETLKKK